MTELPHTRTRTVHWLGTAAALAALVGAASLVQPPDASAGTAAVSTEAAGHGPDPAKARYPVDCGSGPGARVQVLDRVSADFDGDGRPETVAAVRCATGAGTPPTGVYVLADRPGQQRPRIVATLVPISQGMATQKLSLRGRTVGTTLYGYSSPDVPRCCPDRQRQVRWVWQDGRFVLHPGPAQRGGGAAGSGGSASA